MRSITFSGRLYRALNPMGKVPALRDGDAVVTEQIPDTRIMLSVDLLKLDTDQLGRSLGRIFGAK